MSSQDKNNLNIADPESDIDVEKVLAEHVVELERALNEHGIDLDKPLPEAQIDLDTDTPELVHYIDFDEVSESTPARFEHAMEEIDYYAVDARYGAPLSKIREELLEVIEKPDIISDTDLVAKLIKDPVCSGAWNKLVANDFCNKMNTRRAGDAQMIKGFKAYMVQDFFYLQRLISFNAERSVAAPDIKTYTSLSGRTSRSVKYSFDHLTVLTSKLNIPAEDVFRTGRAKVLISYLNFLIQEAQKKNWMVSLVALIPCVQSYYTIAYNIEKTGKVDKNSIWYKHFVALHKSFKGSADKQRALFRANAHLWKPYYPVLRVMFITACLFEEMLWNLGNKV